MLRFRWNQKTNAAAVALAIGKPRQQVAAEIGITRMTLWRWLQATEFSAEVDRLSLEIDIARRAHRLRIAMRTVRQLTDADGMLKTTKDALDWLRYAKSESNAHERSMATLAQARAQNGSK